MRKPALLGPLKAPVWTIIFGVLALHGQNSFAVNNCATSLEKYQTTAYPEKILLASLNRSVKLNAWIDLSRLAPEKIEKLFTEFAKKNYVIEFSGGERGQVHDFFWQEGERKKDAKLPYVSMRHPLQAGKSSDSFPLFMEGDRQWNKKWNKVRINATPQKKVPPVFLLESALAEEIAKTKMSETDIALIRKKSAGIMTLAEFLLDPRFRIERRKNVFLLGNDGPFYRDLAEARNYEVFETVYDDYYKDGTLQESAGPWDTDNEGPRSDVTDLFMREIKAYQLVFLIPDNFPAQANKYGKSKPGYTYDEWLWFKENPKAMKGVIFVVGAENSLGPSAFLKISYREQRKEQEEAKNGLFNSPEEYLLK